MTVILNLRNFREQIVFPSFWNKWSRNFDLVWLSRTNQRNYDPRFFMSCFGQLMSLTDQNIYLTRDWQNHDRSCPHSLDDINHIKILDYYLVLSFCDDFPVISTIDRLQNDNEHSWESSLIIIAQRQEGREWYQVRNFGSNAVLQSPVEHQIQKKKQLFSENLPPEEWFNDLTKCIGNFRKLDYSAISHLRNWNCFFPGTNKIKKSALRICPLMMHHPWGTNRVIILSLFSNLIIFAYHAYHPIIGSPCK